MIYFIIGLILLLVLFLWSACKLSSRYSEWEERNYNVEDRR